MLAEECKAGYAWHNGLLVHSVQDEDDRIWIRIVLPKCRRRKILELAHDKTAHVGVKKIINSRFVWPGLGTDVVDFVRTCDVCIRINKADNKKVKMLEWPVVS